MSAPAEPPGVLARLSTTVTVEQGPAGHITLWRDSPRPNTAPVAITLRPQAEEALLALLLARRGSTATEPTTEENR